MISYNDKIELVKGLGFAQMLFTELFLEIFYDKDLNRFEKLMLIKELYK